MKNKIKIIITLSLIFDMLLVVNLTNFASANINISDPEYLKELNEFNKTDRVPVIIGVSSEDVREEVRSKSRKQEEEKSIDSLEINIEEDQKSLEAHMEDLNKSELNDLDSDLNTLERGIK